MTSEKFRTIQNLKFFEYYIPFTLERSVEMVRKKLPIGIENFEEFSSEDFYYVDKTLFIKELL